MKYLIIRTLSGAELPFFCLPPVTPRALLAMVLTRYPSATLVAAGYVRPGLSPTGEPTLQPFGWSETFNQGPREEDAQLLTILCQVTLDSAECILPAQRMHS